MKMQLVGIALALSIGTSAFAQTSPPFGTLADTAYAAEIWAYLQAHDLAGPDRIQTAPYEGTDPHGMMLETFYTKGTVGNHTGDLIVKNNYGPAGVTADEVLANPAAHLGAVTIMFRREKGYDLEDQDWFWAKYLPDGTLDKNPAGMPLAGRVAKDMDQGCIACHSGADGNDMVFTTNHLSE